MSLSSGEVTKLTLFASSRRLRSSRLRKRVSGLVALRC